MSIFKGKTVNEAIEKGLKELQIDKKYTNITVLQEPSKGILGVFEKEAEVEIIVLSEEEFKAREIKKKLQKLLMIGGGVLFVLSLFILFFFLPKEEETEETKIHVPTSSKEFAGKHYEIVVAQLEEAGFTNIKTKEMDDLVVGFLKKEGEVESVLIGTEDNFVKGEMFEKDVKIIVSYHDFEEEVTETSVTLSETSSTISTTEEGTNNTVSNPTTVEILTIENNTEFAGILNSENSELANQFAEKYYGKVIEFDGHVAHIAPHRNYKTRYDILLYGGDYMGSDSTTYNGVNLQFSNVATTSEAFSNLDGLIVGQNLHIKAQVVEYNTVSGLLRLEPVQVTAR